ncbi:MAG: type II toxin-antitoxin system VapC family toxin [Xanthobacteraceae bacterium]|jgi:predicted nucleic acid-binding protein
MVILDTNVVSELMDSEPDPPVIQWLDRQSWSSLWTTSITVLEIRYGLTIMTSGRRRAQREAAFARLIEENFENRVLQFDYAAAEETALLMGARHRSGRTGELRDNMIAGIALAQRAMLATRNVRHFDDLRVALVNPWHA